jgi:hypothetical protein
MKDKLPIPDESEFYLLTNKDIYIKIQSLEAKVTELFGEIAQTLEPIVEDFNSTVPDELRSKNPKISRGNNYNGLPWTILDFPRNFDKAGVFAFRLLCLRGNSFILTLHLSRKFYQNYKNSIFENLELFKQNQYLITKGNSEWDHNINNENYIEIPINKNEIVEIKNKIELIQYIKFAKAIPFNEWNNLTSIIQAEYNFLLKTLN